MSPIAQFVCDAHGRLIDANDAAARVWGEPPPLVESPDEYGAYRGWRPNGEPLAPEDWGLARAMRTGERVEGEELEIVGFDGVHRTILNYAAAIRDAGGELVGGVAANVDITERKRAEEWQAFLARATESLAESLAYERTVQKVIDGVAPRFADWVMVDLLPRGSDRLLTSAIAHADPDVRERALLVRREPPPEPEARPGVYEVLRTGRALHVAAPTEGAESMLGPYEHLGVHSFVVAPLRVGNETIGTLALVYGSSRRSYDASAVTMAQALAVRIAHAVAGAWLHEAMQDAVAAREQALATVAHDLKNPLNIVVGSAALLFGMIPTSTPEGRRMRQLVEAVDRASRTMDQLITDCLDLSKLEAGHAGLRWGVADARELVLDACESIRPLAQSKGVRVETQVAATCTVRCDPHRVAQVLANLLGNAVKFSPDGGLITVRLGVEARFARFCVEDEGPGVAAEQLPLLFEPYWRAPDSAQAGTGLGLAIAKRIVEAHGGHIAATNRNGKGAVFHFTLPRSGAP